MKALAKGPEAFRSSAEGGLIRCLLGQASDSPRQVLYDKSGNAEGFVASYFPEAVIYPKEPTNHEG